MEVFILQIITVKKNSLIRNIAFILILVIGFGIVVFSKDIKTPLEEIKIYFTDAEIMMLIPVKTAIPKKDKQQMAQYALDSLIKGHDDNKKIRRILPNEKDSFSVTVKGEIAYVDINSDVIDKIPDGRDIEMLAVYSIVNTLTGIDGIVNVRFTIDGESRKSLKGFIDMRETFIPDYFV